MNSDASTCQLSHCKIPLFYRRRADIIPNAFCLKEVNVDNINQILNSMCANKDTGLDDLSARFIKYGAKVIAPMITHIVNMSIRQGIIPDDLKRTLPKVSKCLNSE